MAGRRFFKDAQGHEQGGGAKLVNSWESVGLPGLLGPSPGALEFIGGIILVIDFLVPVVIALIGTMLLEQV